MKSFITIKKKLVGTQAVSQWGMQPDFNVSQIVIECTILCISFCVCTFTMYNVHGLYLTYVKWVSVGFVALALTTHCCCHLFCFCSFFFPLFCLWIYFCCYLSNSIDSKWTVNLPFRHDYTRVSVHVLANQMPCCNHRLFICISRISCSWLNEFQ